MQPQSLPAGAVLVVGFLPSTLVKFVHFRWQFQVARFHLLLFLLLLTMSFTGCIYSHSVIIVVSVARKSTSTILSTARLLLTLFMFRRRHLKENSIGSSSIHSWRAASNLNHDCFRLSHAFTLFLFCCTKHVVHVQ